jgi:hypothetical protein
VLPHPPHSPDLALFNYTLFDNIKDALQSERFPSKEALQALVHDWYHNTPKQWVCEAICKLVNEMAVMYTE